MLEKQVQSDGDVPVPGRDETVQHPVGGEPAVAGNVGVFGLQAGQQLSELGYLFGGRLLVPLATPAAAAAAPGHDDDVVRVGSALSERSQIIPRNVCYALRYAGQVSGTRVSRQMKCLLYLR